MHHFGGATSRETAAGFCHGPASGNDSLGQHAWRREAMGDGSHSMQAFGALPEAAALLADPRPAWIWSADGGRVLWTNRAGGRRLGLHCHNGLELGGYSESHPLRRDLQNAARMAGPDGAVARLRLHDRPQTVPIACRVRRIAAPDGEEGILVVAEGDGETSRGGNGAAQEARVDPSEEVAAVPPVRSPIPDWIRARLATFPPKPAAGAENGPSPDTFDQATAVLSNGGPGQPGQPGDVAGLSPEERAAFDEIATTLGARWPAPPQPAANDDGAFPPADAEARLREMTSILAIAADGVVILDSAGLIESLDAGARALLGVGETDAVGRAFAELLAPDSRPGARACLADAAAERIEDGRELQAETEDGAVPVLVTFGRLAGAGPPRLCAVLRDLTGWKQAEAELVAACRKAEAASSRKSDFLARVSHEIRTPLNGIIGFADVIMEERFGPLGNDRYREYVRDIRTSGEHVLSLVNDLLDIAKIEAGKMELDFADVALNQLVRECVMLMQPAAARARIILRTSLASDLPAVRADARTIRQVILNILSNAVKFTGAGGQVIVSTGNGEGGVVLKVRDTGDGMTEAELARALEPFRQLATNPLRDRTGTGLGLPLTKALAEANRAVFAISSTKGEGTIVKVSFPAASFAAEAS
jgi:PAS domain S-box-containing protein